MPPARPRQASALTPGQKAAATRRRNAELRRQQQQREQEPPADAERPEAAARVRFDLSDDALAPVSTGQLRQSLSDFAATMAATDEHVESISSKVDGLDGKLDALIARMGGPSASTSLPAAPLGADSHPAPLRGQYGECPPLSRRYGYIDEKLRGEAMAGTMAPEKLPLLLPVGSSLATRLNEDDDTFEVNGVTVTKKKVPDQAAVLAKFLRGIPKPSAFAAAWGVYTDLVLHGMGAFDAKTVADAHSALLSHGTWILEHAENFTWESCMSYHLTVANERKDGFSCTVWYKNFDGDAWGTIGVRKPTAQPATSRHPVQQAANPRPAAAPAATQAASNAGRKDRACVNWNAGLGPAAPIPPSLAGQLLTGAEFSLIELSKLAFDAGLVPPTQPPPPRPNTNCGYALFDPTDTPATPSPLRADAWAALLDGYPDRTLVANILGIIRHGAKLGYVGPLLSATRPASQVRNHPLDQAGILHVTDTIRERTAQGRTRPVDDDADVIVSPVGTVPKANGKRRTINDLSWPRKRQDGLPSVNAGINRELVTLRYDSLDHLFLRIRAAESPPDLWKADLKDAFFHVSVASRDARLLGYHFQGTTYVDCTLNFGGRSSPFIFNLFAEALHWIVASFGLCMTHYLDDSFGDCPSGKGRAILDFFKAACSLLGVSVSDSKSATGHELEILGVMVNSRDGRAWLSPAKLDRLRLQLDQVLSKPRAEPAELQALAGFLNFVSRVCPTGRAFMRRIYDAANASNSDWTSRSTSGALGDEIRWWRSMIDRWDGVMIIPRDRPRVEIWSDAATTRGIGAHLGPHEACTAALSSPVPDKHAGKGILFLETLAALEALRLWGRKVEGAEIMFKIDNSALVASLRSGRCDNRPTMALIREIFALALELHVTIVPDWVPSAVNDVADALSRFDWPYLRSHRPHVPPLLPAPSHARIAPVPAGSLAPPPLPPPLVPYADACFPDQPEDG